MKKTKEIIYFTSQVYDDAFDRNVLASLTKLLSIKSADQSLESLLSVKYPIDRRISAK